MLANFLGGFLVLAGFLPMGIPLPGVESPEATYTLDFLLCVMIFQGVRLLAFDDDPRASSPPVLQEPIALPVRRREDYIRQHQALRESNRPKQRLG